MYNNYWPSSCTVTRAVSLESHHYDVATGSPGSNRAHKAAAGHVSPG